MTTTSHAESSPPKTLAICPDSPNCVSSQATDSEHYIEALSFSVPAENAWQALLNILKRDKAITLIEITEDRIRAEAHSRIFGFVDDLEFILWPEQPLIHVRSAARSGYWDLGVNRKRVKSIFEVLRMTLTTK